MPWVHSIGLAKGPHGYFVTLSVDTTHPDSHKAPMHIDGVEIVSRATKRERMNALVGADFGDSPISVVRDGGPIYKTPDGIVMLSPGRYTYSNVYLQSTTTGSPWAVTIDTAVEMPNAQAFPIWLETFSAFVKVLRKASEHTATMWEVIDPPKLIYTDYEFQVEEPIPWAKTIPGLPTWLPSGVDMVADYWGRGERSPRYTYDEFFADIKKLPEKLPSIPQVSGLLWGAAALGAIILLSQNQRKRGYR
jgi:hypothetical protein